MKHVEDEKVINIQHIVEDLSDIISETKDINKVSLEKILENEKILTDLLVKKENDNTFEIDCELITEITRTLVELLVLQKESNQETINKLEDKFKKTQVINEQLLKENEFLLKDQLTWLGNRHLFKKEVEPYIKELIIWNNIESINYAILDIDDFKKINDSYGHIIGDAILKYFANFLTKNLKWKEIKIYRFWGEEFILVSFNKDNLFLIKELRELLNKLNKTVIRNKKEKINKDIEIKLSFSGWTATIKKQDKIVEEVKEQLSESFEIITDYLYDIADKKLYQVKENGKNNVI